jgi:hypothetical protein
MSRFDVTSALEGLIKAKEIRLRDAIVLVERLVIMCELVKRL